ncbi:hypothetical protein Taro_009630 [Colocasia esculenta]|uniref:ZF-HD dimerization-type domain-containing protein n=1 Tax=Colocasia esculenta TaxID=4460 RepID=A0A843U1D5_COLES|nr:hypothetical protein [Colocasia esculenta]
MDLSGHEGEIPIPITSSTYVGGGHGHGHGIIHEPPLHSSNGPTHMAAANAEDHHHHGGPAVNSSKKVSGVFVKYRECLKNHAASIGGNALDGCGEFMPSGEEGTLEALKCAACSCHRNFHRKEIEGEAAGAASCECYGGHHHGHHHLKGRKVVGQKGVLISGTEAYGYSPAGNSLIPRPSPHHMIMPLGALQTSESDEMEGVGGGGMSRAPMVKKRFRTKFTPEQKEKMLSFAEKVGWRLQKQEENVVQQFCQEIGVKRRVLKVWMHNNKHNLAKKSSPLQLE